MRRTSAMWLLVACAHPAAPVPVLSNTASHDQPAGPPNAELSHGVWVPKLPPNYEIVEDLTDSRSGFSEANIFGARHGDDHVLVLFDDRGQVLDRATIRGAAYEEMTTECEGGDGEVVIGLRPSSLCNHARSKGHVWRIRGSKLVEGQAECTCVDAQHEYE